MTCILCRVSLPVSSKRRRLHGVSSVGDLALLQQESSKLGVGTIIPPRSAAQGPYLCIVSSAGVLALLQQESSKLGIGTIIPPPPPDLLLRALTSAFNVSLLLKKSAMPELARTSWKVSYMGRSILLHLSITCCR